VSRCGDILDAIQQTEDAIDAIDGAAQLVLECTGQQRMTGVGRVPKQILMQRQAVVIARRLLDDECFEHGSRTDDRQILATELLDGDDGLVTKKPIGIVEGGDERVHSALRPEQRERGRDVAADPDLLSLIEQRVCERIDDRLAVADERLSRVRLEGTMAEQREQPRHEETV
jgi:hypothetical protein